MLLLGLCTKYKKVLGLSFRITWNFGSDTWDFTIGGPGWLCLATLLVLIGGSILWQEKWGERSSLVHTHSKWARLYTHINLASLASHTFAKVWLGRLYLAASRFIYDLLQGHKQAYSPLGGWLVAPATLAPRREARMVLETRQIAQPWNNKVKGVVTCQLIIIYTRMRSPTRTRVASTTSHSHRHS